MCAATMSQPSSHTVDHEAFFPGGAYQISTRPWFGVVPPTRRVSTPGGGVASPGGAFPAIAKSGARKAKARRNMDSTTGRRRNPREDEIRFVSRPTPATSKQARYTSKQASKPGIASTPETLARYHSKDGSAPLGNHIKTTSTEYS
jgi:hypothetical protein